MNTQISTEAPRQISLYYREGNSDRVYQCSIEPKEGLFVVNFTFGRRGTTLNAGTKTRFPVPYELATQIYEKLIRDKMAKGYTEGPDGTPYQQTEMQERSTGILPQLLNPVSESEAERLIPDCRFCAQEKYDGRRVFVLKEGDRVTGINRKGLVIALPESIVNAAQKLPGDFLLDGECVGDVLYAFDVLRGPGIDLTQRAYQQRLMVLKNHLTKADQKNIRFSETAFAPGQKQDLLNWLKREGREGIVFKHLDAVYTPGRPAKGGPQLKFKFHKTLSAVVAQVNCKRSVEMRLLNGNGWVACGNVSIPVNHVLPEVGQVIEVRYLYAFRESNALFQPVFIGRRDDVEPYECVFSQVRYKPDSAD